MTEGAAAGRWDVLVVDDEQVVGESVRLVLGAEGLRVAVALDGAAGLAHPALASCRLVVCDLMLPDRSGLDLVREIRALRPEVALLAITGYATPSHGAQAIEAGATEFLAKPFDDAELLAAVWSVLGTEGDGVRSRLPGDHPQIPTNDGGSGS